MGRTALPGLPVQHLEEEQDMSPCQLYLLASVGGCRWWRPAWEPGATRRAPLVGNDFSSYHKGLQDQERCLPPPPNKKDESKVLD